MEDDNEDIEKQNGTTEDAENELVITKEVEGSGPIRKSRKLVFSKMERNTILNNEMLTDESINIAQILLQKQFPKHWRISRHGDWKSPGIRHNPRE